MPDTLSISLVPGYLPAEDELIDNAILRLIARPTVTLIGSIGAATLSDGAVTTAKLANGALSADATGRAKMADEFLTAAKLNATQDWTGKTLSGTPTVTWSGAVNFSGATFTPPPGYVRQVKYSSKVAISSLTAANVATGDLTAGSTATIPVDDTIPGNTEGALLFSLAITAASAANLVEVTVHIPMAGTFLPTGTFTVALFQDGVCVAVRSLTHSYSNTFDTLMEAMTVHYLAVVGTAAATTFTVRVGTTSPTLYINGNGGRLYGGASAATLTIKEITA